MSRVLLGALVAVMLILTGAAAYSTFTAPEPTIPTSIGDSPCCSQQKVGCGAACPAEAAAPAESCPACEALKAVSGCCEAGKKAAAPKDAEGEKKAEATTEKKDEAPKE
jgi:hypothetical protein